MSKYDLPTKRSELSGDSMEIILERTKERYKQLDPQERLEWREAAATSGGSIGIVTDDIAKSDAIQICLVDPDAGGLSNYCWTDPAPLSVAALIGRLTAPAPVAEAFAIGANRGLTLNELISKDQNSVTFSVTMQNGRLKIDADVDAGGLANLRKILTSYASIIRS